VINPGVFFYWIEVPNNGATTQNFTITQSTNFASNFYAIGAGSAVFTTAGCATDNATGSTITQSTSTGAVTVTFTNPGGTSNFFIGIKYSATSLKDDGPITCPINHILPSFTYTFSTYTGLTPPSGFIPGSTQMLGLVPKVASC
jgi:hypothetical protein